MKQCLIVDDHPIVRIGLAHVVAMLDGAWQCHEAATLDDAKTVLATTRVDLVLLDVNLGDASGLDLLPWLASHSPGIPVLVLSMHDELALVERALQAGARGYLLKDSAGRELAGAIATVMAGRRHVPFELAERLYFRKLECQGVDSLTPRELDVFRLLAEGLPKGQIAARLAISPNTVETHRQRLRIKLGARDNLQLVRLAVSHFGAALGVR